MSLHNLAEYSCSQTTCNSITNIDWVDLCNFVHAQSREHPDHPALSNMLLDTDAGFLHNINNNTRWTDSNGEIAILRFNTEIVGVSCVEISEFHPTLSIGGIRCWVDQRHRSSNQVSKYLLSANLQWSIDRNLSAMMLTFNNYNKIIYDAICRKSSGHAVGFGKIWSNWWDDCIPILSPLSIRHTEQWCVVKPINIDDTQQLLSEIKSDA